MKYFTPFGCKYCRRVRRKTENAIQNKSVQCKEHEKKKTYGNTMAIYSKYPLCENRYKNAKYSVTEQNLITVNKM